MKQIDKIKARGKQCGEILKPAVKKMVDVMKIQWNGFEVCSPGCGKR